MTAGRWLAIVIAVLILFGSGHVTWRLLKDRKEHFARQATLRDQLSVMRKAIETFHNEKKRYPHTLQELVPQYVRQIPVDPITASSTTWRVTTEDEVQPNSDFTTTTTKTESYVIDVHSGARAPYSEW